MPTLSWRDTIRYCAMRKDSEVAQNLAVKAKKGRRLSQREIGLIHEYAEVMIKRVGTENKIIAVPKTQENFYLSLNPDLLLHGDRAEAVFRKNWLVDKISDTVLGKAEGGSLTLYPNHLVHVADLAREMLKYGG